MKEDHSGHTHFSDYQFKEPLLVSGSLIGLGLIATTDNAIFSNSTIAEARNEYIPCFQTNAEDYLLYAPMVSVYVLNLSGVMGKNNLANTTALLLKSQLLTAAIVWPLKYATHEGRPDGSNDQSFPSGHTSFAFSAATFMHKEYGKISIWYSISAYVTATSVGALRIMNNKHYISDVLVGAGIGILATNMVYATHQYKWGDSNNISMQIVPSYDQGRIGFYGQLNF